MERPELVLGLIGVVCVGLGLLMTVHQGFAEWYVVRSGRGRLWARMLGEERAVKAMRRVFGPLALLVGIALGGSAIVLALGAA